MKVKSELRDREGISLGSPRLVAAPSPCFVLDERALECNLAIIDAVREAAGVEIIVALKACAMWSVFPHLAAHSDGATASSLAEARLVAEEFRAGGSERGPLAHTYAPVYTDADFDQIAALSSHLTFNSVAQFERFHHRGGVVDVPRSSGSPRPLSFGLRVNPGYSPVETDLYNPALPGSRLGIERLDELPQGVEGLHFHVLCESGAEHLKRALEALEQRFGHLLDVRFDNGEPRLKWLNCGGGHLMTREGYDVDLLISTLREFRARHPHLRLILEPGSAFTWRTGFLVSTVEDVVESGGIRTAMLDVSFACHMPDCLEMPYQPSIVGAVAGPGYRLGGNSCLAGDWMGEWDFGRELRVGDRVVFEDMIHYTMVKTTMFNGITHPSIAILRTNDRFDVVRRFTPADFKNRVG